MDINLYSPLGFIRKKHLVTLANYTENEIYEILLLAEEIRMRLSAGEKLTTLKNKYVSLLTKRGFARSRIAFETAVTKLSGVPIVSAMRGSELEDIINDKLTLQAVAGYGISAIVVQTADNTDADKIEKTVDIPIINANSNSGPCEALSALLAVKRRKGRLSGLKVSAVGSPAAYEDSFLYAFATCGMDITVICGEDDGPSEKTINHCRQFVDFKEERDLAQGIKGADVIYVSSAPNEFELTRETLEKYAPNAVILHTLPVDENSLSSEITALPCFLGLEEAYCLPEVEMAALTLLLASK